MYPQPATKGSCTSTHYTTHTIGPVLCTFYPQQCTLWARHSLLLRCGPSYTTFQWRIQGGAVWNNCPHQTSVAQRCPWKQKQILKYS